MQVRARALIAGRVQGVYFRDSTRKRAELAGVTGWVRNRPDGRVEALFEGEEEAVRGLIAWCHTGPPHARVADVAVEWEQPTGEFGRFSIV
ncbi:MAG TPA: acylphosphatase [Thermomicrobiales bacterium]|nr:acylphosphatase [Thermomicrobiales bacterium]